MTCISTNKQENAIVIGCWGGAVVMLVKSEGAQKSGVGISTEGVRNIEGVGNSNNMSICDDWRIVSLCVGKFSLHNTNLLYKLTCVREQHTHILQLLTSHLLTHSHTPLTTHSHSLSLHSFTHYITHSLTITLTISRFSFVVLTLPHSLYHPHSHSLD